jgi:uncharacterized glyoxalase superfamily protein PhnB
MTQTSKAPPPGWPRISASVFYDDAAAAIDWLCEGFGFEVKLRIEGENGRIEHSELTFGEGLVMVGQTGRRPHCLSPESAGGNTVNLCVYVDDVDAHCEVARAAGAEIVDEPTTTDYGEDYWADRGYQAVDPQGHHWFFMQRVRGAGAD